MAKPLLFTPAESPYSVPTNGKWRLAKQPTTPPKGYSSQKKKGKKRNKKMLAAEIEKLGELQQRLYADNRRSLLLVFQAMDAAGKDGTIRAVMSGINPAGCQVFSFKRPSSEEIDHDFLWRVHRRAPERGRIGIFNRSHYEEVLVVRVNPGILDAQQLSYQPENIFEQRYESIRDFEKHLARNGTVVLKFFLNVSRDEQKRRLIERIDNSAKNWKFESGDVKVRQQWDSYMNAYQMALNKTSRMHAPWYAIPADDKPFMRATVASIVRRTLEGLDLAYPTLSDEELADLGNQRVLLERS